MSSHIFTASAPIRFGAVVALLTLTATAQTWLLAHPEFHPRPREGHGMVFDAARNVTILFGGSDPQGFYNETWEWNGTDWALRPLAMAPAPRRKAGMAYDSARQRVVLFGGSDYSHILGDSWEWDGASWLERFPQHTPGARYDMAMVFDAAHQNSVLFGGYNGIKLDETWLWDGTDWTHPTPSLSPEARTGSTFAYDIARTRCVMFGGDGNLGYLGDTWLWDGSDWTEQLTAHAPTPRGSSVLAYDSARERMVLFGGWSALTRIDDTWEYDGSDWSLQPLTLSPERRAHAAMSYDARSMSMVLFGGRASTTQGDTWLYRHGTLTSTFSQFGQGCAGSVGMPELAIADGMPVVGTRMKVACTSLQPDHFTTMWMGFSRTNWSLGSLPYDLGAFGMTGCTLFVSGDFVVPLLNWNGVAVWHLSIPNAPQILGLPFYLQAGVIDRVNELGMVVTNAAEAHIGDQ
jgi:hypothetical protein